VKLRGKCSWFGGPSDTGVSPSENLAFIYSIDMAPELFLPEQPPGTTGLARRLDPETFFIAVRWNYDETSKEDLLDIRCLVRSPKTGKEYVARPADWGPHIDTGRVADISKGLMDALGIQTDDEVEVTYPYGEQEAVKPMYKSVCISSGHGLYVRGASGVNSGGFDEVDEARRLVERVADELDARGVSVSVFHDNTSKTQSENLNTIVNWHNAQGAHDLNVSAHFNAFDGKAHGTEVLYLTQPELASEMSAAIATAGGFTNRGGKKRTDLAFLNKTKAPAILLETCFCDSAADAELYEIGFSRICDAIADVLGGKEATPPIEPPKPEPAEARVDIGVTGNVAIYVNGKLIQ
jgi:N-acetylmuramoyl-L-alanine amidase